MSSARVFFTLVAGYVGIVLWWLAFGDSLQALADLRARLRQRWQYWRHGLAIALQRLGAAAGGTAREGIGSRRYLPGALAGATIAILTAVAVVGMRDPASRGKVGRQATPRTQRANPVPLQPSRALSPPVTAVHANARGARPGQVRRPRERPTQVVSDLISVSAHVTPTARTASSTQVPRSAGPAPLPAPAQSAAPSPLAAP